MDTRQLHYVIEIAECGNISRAAEKLYISQSGLNQQLQQIEKNLGIRIFDRSTHHLALTEAGDIFLQYAKEAVNREKQMQTMLQDSLDGRIGQISLNLAMEQGIELFSMIFPQFHQEYPQIELKLEDHTVADQYKLILDHKLDIGMVMIKSREIEDLEYVHLANERLLLGVPSSHPLSRLYHITDDGDYPELDLSLCAGETFALMFHSSTLRQVIDPCFSNAGFTPNIMFESRTNHVLAMMASKGICLTILPESQAKLYRDICWFRLEENPIWESCMIYHKEQPLRKAGRYLIKLAVEHGKSLEKKSQPNWNLT